MRATATMVLCSCSPGFLHFKREFTISSISAIQFENSAIMVDGVQGMPWFDSRRTSRDPEKKGGLVRYVECETRKTLSGWKEPVTRPPVYQMRYVNEKRERYFSVDELSYYLESDGRYLHPKTLHMITRPGEIAKSLIATGITWATRDLVKEAQRLRIRRTKEDARFRAMLRGRA